MGQYTFSLIMATYGRIKEVARMLESLKYQTYDLSKIEIWVVDQNQDGILNPIIETYKEYFSIYHIHSSRKGLSYNRNLALKEAKGDIIAFPDDDCVYYENTLQSVAEFFEKNTEIDCALGRIYDRRNQQDIIRRWKKKSFKLTWWNFFWNISSITMFFKSEGDILLFDERLGTGTYYGSCEDTDYIVRFLKRERKILYSPSIEVWHPVPNRDSIDQQKVYSYGLGFGAFCRKNYNFPIVVLFVEVILYHIIMAFKSGLQGDIHELIKRRTGILARIQGIYKWRVK